MMKKKTILSSVLTIVLCLSLIAGSTYALFTSEDQVNIAVNAATVEMKASVTNISTSSLGVAQTDGAFANGGSASFENQTLTLALMTPGDLVSFNITGTNTSTVATQYRYIIECVEGTDLMRGLIVTINGTKYETLSSYTSAWADLAALTDMEDVSVSIELPASAGVEYQDLNTKILVTLEAVQGNAGKTDGEEVKLLPDEWNGTVDTSWYDETATEMSLETAEAVAGFADLVNKGTDSFEGKTLTLSTDVDLSGYNFTPIGGVEKGAAFQGTFDGQGHTISGMTENGWDLGYSYGQTAGMGLFGWVANATIKDVNIDNAEISMEAVVMGGVAGYATGDCTFEGITVSNSQIANYNWDTGGIVGQIYGKDCTFTFKDITIDESTTISGHWGTWDVSAGGVVGRTADGVKVVMEDITVACVLDVYNDVCAAYQWYAYRYSGMLVGYTKTTETVDGRTVATAPHVECKNVTVIYGDWMNYTYCQPSNVSPQFVRVQGGYSTDPYYSGRHWTAGVDANGNKMVDDNHVHAEGQAHNQLIPFDQLFGGGQGVYGTATHPGVTIVYPDSYNSAND